jgi:hypothetical protein
MIHRYDITDILRGKQLYVRNDRYVRIRTWLDERFGYDGYSLYKRAYVGDDQCIVWFLTLDSKEDYMLFRLVWSGDND